ncbi:hypothetical protein ACFCYM_23475 [Streptomyces sp. NPDC056254]|uniref:hypothetical protein n=1 Tax=unclassified Streptomyces TaxID=2593676 RepID=UPI0004AB6786|nr:MULTISPECIES: hypothetical protein [unclassified Streptomyces]APU39732.1 hypothetical protein BSL84_08075 [Streptomyces sp. TN58]KJK49824.1 membrane protein [Streptomyces sp. NRRL F-4428]
MKIDWVALGSVFGVSLFATVALVTLFTLGLVGLSKHEAATEQGGSATLARGGAYLCFALITAAVTYGIYLIVA